MAVGNRFTPVPPHRTGRAAFPHPAPTSDIDGKAVRPSVRAPASVTHFPGSVSGVWKAELEDRRGLRLTDQDASGVQIQGSNSPRRRLGQLLTSLVSTSTR